MLNDLANRAIKAGVSVMGEPVTLTRGDDSQSFKGIFQDSYKSLDPSTGAPVTTLQPVLQVNRSDLAFEPKNGDAIAVRSTGYRIRDMQSDGHTGLILLLQRTSPRT
tara:strand:- start:1561 stop:1881 length:321 start_codon:yes stop_codon:yes gene_type:complete